GGERDRRPAQAVRDGELAGGGVRHRGREEARARGRGAALEKWPRGGRVGEEAAEGRPEQDTEARPRRAVGRLEAGSRQRAPRREQHELRHALRARGARPHRLGEHRKGDVPRGHRARPGDGDRPPHARPSTSAALVPAKPEELETATSTACARAVPTTRSRPSQAGSSVSSPAVGGILPSASTRAQRMASKAPAAPRVWPMAPLIESTGTTRRPKTRVKATASMASL